MQKVAPCSIINSSENGKKRALFIQIESVRSMECHAAFLNDGCKDYAVTSKMHMIGWMKKDRM